MPDLPPEVVALGGKVERTSRRLEEVEDLIQQLAGDVHTIATRLAGESSSPTRVRSWLEIDDAELARIVIADLVDWLERVYLRYWGVKLPTCWLWHADAVEELWCLRNTHREATAGRDASWARLQDWHDKQRPAVVHRLDAAIGGCELGCHAVGGELDRPLPGVPFVVVADLLAESWAEHRIVPLPTEPQLREAQRLQHSY